MALVMHLVFDFHKLHSGGKIRHWLSALLAVTVSLLGGLVNQLITNVHWWQFTLLSLGIHFALFDPIWNLINKHPFFYNGDPNNPDRALLDKMYDYLPPWGAVFLRLWVIACTAGVYFHLDWIVSGYPGN